MRESGRLLRGAYLGEEAEGTWRGISIDTHLPWTAHWQKNRASYPEREDGISYELRILHTSRFLGLTYRRTRYSLCGNTHPPRKSPSHAEFWATNWESPQCHVLCASATAFACLQRREEAKIKGMIQPGPLTTPKILSLLPYSAQSSPSHLHESCSFFISLLCLKYSSRLLLGEKRKRTPCSIQYRRFLGRGMLLQNRI